MKRGGGEPNGSTNRTTGRASGTNRDGTQEDPSNEGVGFRSVIENQVEGMGGEPRAIGRQPRAVDSARADPRGEGSAQ